MIRTRQAFPMRSHLLLALLALAPPAGAKEPNEPRQFLDKSIVTIPRHVGDYTLAETHYEPQAWMYGVTSKWVINAAPAALRYTLFAYPIGLTTEEQAVTQQMDEIERSLREAIKQGTYTDLGVGEREPFVVVARASSMTAKDGDRRKAKDGDGEPAPAEPFDPRPRPEPKIEASDDADPLAATLAASTLSPNSHGQRQSYRFTHDGVAMRSLSYVFYRHLFAFKVRVTAPLDAMDEDTFDALADTATRYLVPQVEVENYGQCGSISLPGPPPAGKGRNRKPQKDEDSARFARELILGIARVKAANCATSPGDDAPKAKPAGAQIEIVYPQGIWKASD